MRDGFEPCLCGDPACGRCFANPIHAFRPALVGGKPVLRCRRCGEFYDHPNHDLGDD